MGTGKHLESPSVMADTLPNPDGEDTPVSMRLGRSAAANELLGKLLGERYRVTERLGAGGMGTVYRAEHIDIRKPVAIKALNRELLSQPDAVERFVQEARAASRIGNPHVVEITDFGYTDDDAPFFAMELLDGEDLRATIQHEGRLPWPRARHIMLQILDALAAAHARGVIHRDMKPANCFRTTRADDADFIKVVDFGLAKLLGDHPDYQSLSVSGVLVGTPSYMSPEQATGEQIDARTDVYSAGVVAFELLTGVAPFRGASFMIVIAKMLTEPAPAMRDLAPDIDVPSAVEEIVQRAMAKRPEDRYQSAADFAAALRAVPVSPTRSTGPLMRRSAIAAAVMLPAALGLWLASQRAPLEDPVTDVEPPALTTTVAAEVEGAASKQAASVAPTEPARDEPDPALDEATRDEATHDKPGLDEPTASEPVATNAAAKGQIKRTPKPREQALEELPDTLSREQMKPALAAAERAARTCGQQHGSLLTTVKIEFEIAPSGEVSNAGALAPMKGTPVGTCAAEALAVQRFPASRSGTSGTVTLPLR